LPENMRMKINKMPGFYMIFASKIFFPEFWGTTAPSASVRLRIGPNADLCEGQVGVAKLLVLRVRR